MPKTSYKVGLLLSVTGPYGTPSRSMADGIRIAIEQVNADPKLSVAIEPVYADPAGDKERYLEVSARFLAEGIRNIVGCYTSLSRKVVLPLVEAGAALLWFPMHYEGFETAANVIYTGASPNHHIVPLAAHLTRYNGTRAYCVGSNYVWAWESNRILRETLLTKGGDLVAETYLAVGDTGSAIDGIVADILEKRPDFVSNTLIGTSSYEFFRRFRAACNAAGIDQATRFPVVSCSLTEAELFEIGPDACDGHIASSVYFSSIASASNRRFLAEFASRGIPMTQANVDAETSYNAIKLLARSLHDAGSDQPGAVLEALGQQRLSAPQGDIWIDPQILHAHLTPRIGRSRKDFTFEILTEAAMPEAPDPYLVRSTPRWEVLPPTALRLSA